MIRDDYTEDTLLLELQALYSSYQLPAGLVQYAKFDVARTVIGTLHATLMTYALSDQAGPVEESYVQWSAARFPRWMPKWLRRRWSSDRTVTLSVTPRYIYPEANVIIPDLGKSRRITMHYLKGHA